MKPQKILASLFLLASFFSPYVRAQSGGPVTVAGTACTAGFDVSKQATIGIQITGTWTGTIQPEVSIAGQPAVDVQVTPSTSSTAQSTITGNGVFTANVSGYSTFFLCGNTVSGTATAYFNVSTTSSLGRSGGGGGGGGVPAGPTSVNSVPQVLTSTPSGGVAGLPTWLPSGVAPNPQTGTSYTYLATDREGYTSFSNSGSIAVTLPQAGSTGFASNWVNISCDIGTGTATITPTTSTISYSTGSAYTSGASSLALTTGQCAWIYSDNTNYFAVVGSGGGSSFSGLTSGTNTSAAMLVGTGGSLGPSGTGAVTANLGTTGGGLVINLISAGAVCNGSTDDTAAIQAVYTAMSGTSSTVPHNGGQIIFPNSSCVMSGTATLFNAQNVTISGGDVLWQGVAANATASTAALTSSSQESYNTVTLTTTSGNWGSSFVVNASILVSGCSVAGYNGAYVIASGGSGGTTLTYLSAATSLAAATGCSAGIVPPVFNYINDRSVTTQGFHIHNLNNSYAMGTTFQIQENTNSGLISSADVFINNTIDGTHAGGLSVGFMQYVGTLNQNNDEMQFYGNVIYNYSWSGWRMTDTQQTDDGFYGNECFSNGFGQQCVDDNAGAGFSWYGGQVTFNQTADFVGYGNTEHPWTLDSVTSEDSNRLVYTGGPSSNPFPLNVINVRFSSNDVNADGHAIIYRMPGPLNVIGGSFGQSTSNIVDFQWITSGATPNYAYGEIVGVNSSALDSISHNLLNFANSPASGVFQAGNVYEDSSGNGAPPTTPDRSSLIGPLLPAVANSYALGSSSLPWSNAFLTAINCGLGGTTSCVITGNGGTSGTATITWPAVAGTATNNLAFSNGLTVPVGAETTPAFTFVGHLANGMWYDPNFGPAISNSAEVAAFTGNGVYVGHGSTFAWSSGNLDGGAAPDTALARPGAGVIEASTSASSPNNSGTFSASGYTAGSSAGISSSGVLCTATFTSVDGIVTACTAVSDPRLKIFQSSTRGLSSILQLQPIDYHYNDLGLKIAGVSADKNTEQTGFNALNVKAVMPEAVGTDENGYLTLPQGDRPIVAALVKGMQEQQEEIEELKAKILALEAQ